MARQAGCQDCIHIDDAATDDFFVAIVKEKVEDIGRIINASKGSDLYHQYVNGHFYFHDEFLERESGTGNVVNMQLPLAVAAVRGASHSIKALLHAGVSPKQLDCHGNNVLHSLVAYLHYHSAREEAIVAGSLQLLLDTVSVHVLREMLQHENAFGLRPLEFAAQHGQGSMVLAILNTPGVYLSKQQVVGLTCYKWYNITEYESTGSDSRWDKSPQVLLAYADKKNVNNNTYIATLLDTTFQSWFHKKLAINLPFICVWFLMRLAFLLGYSVLDYDFSVEALDTNNTEHCIPDAALLLSSHSRKQLTIYLITAASLSLIIDGLELIRMLTNFNRHLFHTISGRKTLVLQYAIYRGSHLILTLSLVIFIPLAYLYPADDLTFVAGLARVISPFAAAWSTLFFVQLLPGIGLFICLIYGMIGDLMKLFVVYILMILPFIQSFYHFINSNATAGCIKGFETVFESFYSLFMVMLNMVDFSEQHVLHGGLLRVTHIVYVFTVSIMLVNFFIAVMMDSVNNACARKHVTPQLQRAGVAIGVEYRLRRFLRFYYRFMVRRWFTCEGDEVFLIGAYPYMNPQ